MVESGDKYTAFAGNISSVQWMATVAFLGVFYCVVFGIFKRFKANFSIGSGGNDELGAVQPRMGVYRNLEHKTYTPVYSQIDEVQSASTLPSQTTLNNSKTKVKTNELTTSNTASSTSIPKINPKPSERIKEIRKPAAPDIPKPSTTTDTQSTAKTVKATAPPKPTENKVKHDDDKKKAEKLRKEEMAKNEEKLKKEKLAQLKKDKELKEKKAKEEKAIKEKEAKDKKEKSKAENMSKKGKAPPKPMNNPPPAPPDLPPYSTLDTKTKMISPKNPAGSLQDLSAKPVVVPNTFSSSWDLVTEHRQNMQKEIRRPTTARNLRAIANQDTQNSRDNPPHKTAQTKGFNIVQRHSGDSNMSNTDA